MYELQAVDLELDGRNARLGEIRTALGDASSLTPLMQESKVAKTEADLASAKQHDLDQIIGGFEAKIAAADAKLYSGTVTLARELTDLQADIDMIKRQRSEQEDILLEVLEEVDSTQARLKSGTSALAEAEQAWKADQASMTEEQGTLQSEVATLTVERTARAGKITAADLALYEQVRKSRKGKAIALLHGSICDSCRVGIPNKLEQEARGGEKVIRCPNCGLILLVE